MNRRREPPVEERTRRRLLRVALAYVGVVVLVWLIAYLAFPAAGIPLWGRPWLTALAALGLPVAIVLAWATHGTEPTRGLPMDGASPPEADGIDEPGERARFLQVQEIFSRLVDVEAPRREAELDRIESHPGIRAEVLELVRAHEDTGPLDRIAKSLEQAGLPHDVPGKGASFAQYTLIDRLGAGGMGVVYEAEDTRLGRRVALKFLAPALGSDPTAKQRFLAEARAAAALDHPNICTILEIGDVDGQLFMAMPYYRGRTLKELLRGGALGPGLALPIALDVGQGLAAAHAAGIIHRDIKPANVIVTDGGPATIVDFGVAKVAQQSLTRTGLALGTVSYMSPEQARGEPVDHRSDIWALGVLLYEMISGMRPFRGPTDQAIQASILASPHESITPYLGDATGLARVIDRALEKDASDRYPTVADMVQALRQVQIGSSPGQGRGEAHHTGGGLMRRGERRQITVLTTRLGAFDELVDQLAPEAFESILHQVQQAVGDAVTAEGGVVHAVHGDRIECVFGVPVAHEDDGKRAVRAAVEASRRCERIADESAPLGVELSLRSAIDTGIVGVQRDGEDGRGYRIGRTLMERAGRLAGEAGPGTLLLSADAHRLVRSVVETEKGPDVGLGQQSGEVQTVRVLGLRAFGSSLEARASGGLTAFTGRAEEVGVLATSLQEALAGSGQIVTVSGDAGIGKSRLLYELERGVLDGHVRVLRGRCQSYGASVPYLPFLDILRDLLEVEGREGHDASQVVARVEAFGEALHTYVPFYLHLLSIPSSHPLPAHLSGDQLRLAIVESIAAILTVASTSSPLALLLEDWHWADDASTAALTQLASLITAFPVLTVVTYRPGYGVRSEALGSHRHLKLSPIVADHAHQIIGSALRVDRVEEEVATRIHSRAQGNPFFMEEMCAALLEQGAITVREGMAALSSSPAALSLPDSVQAVIRTRLDRMTPATREVLGAASVIGRDFTRELVGRALPGAPDLPGALERLQAGGLIQQIRIVPDVTYRFKHALIQEVTYETLLGHHRKVLHRRVGEAVEDLWPEGDDDRPFERLADHFYRAEVWDKAVDYALGAARRASRLSQIPEALQALDLAEGGLGRLSDVESYDRRLDLLLLKERLCETTGERKEQRRIIAELLPLVADWGDPAVEAEVLVRAGDLELSLRDYAAAEAALIDAVERAKGATDSAVHRKALRSLGLLRWHQDRNSEALEILEAVLESDHEAGDTEGIILDHHNLGSVYRSMGDVETALRLAKESVRLAEDSPFRQVYALHTVSLCQRELGQMDEAIATWVRGIRLCEEHHLPLQQSYLMTSLAHLYLQAGRTDDSVALYEDAVVLTRQVRHAEGVARAVSALAGVLEGLGRMEEALPYWTEAATWFGRMQEYDRGAHARTRVATILEEMGEDQRALAAWGHAHQLAGEAGDSDLEIGALEALARLTRRHLGTVRLAVPYYEQAIEIARRNGNRIREGALLNSLGVMAWEAKDYEAAREHYTGAVSCFEGGAEPAALGHALNSLGQTLRRLGEADRARETLERAIAVHREANEAQLEGYGLAALGDLFLDGDRPEEARAAFEESLDIRRSIGDLVGTGWMLERLARTSHRVGELDRVRDLLAEATLIADEVESADLQEACAKLRP